MMAKRAILAALGIGAAMAVAGCSSPAEPAATEEGTSTSAPQSTTTQAADGSAAAAATGLELAAADTALGTVLTDGDGFTLYTFDEDTPTEIKCVGQCAEIWPPSLGAPQAATPLPGSLGTMARPDGTAQATYDGRPLYRFAKDTAPGQTGGDGVKGTWHVVVVDPAAG
ncbi:hypothetical protein [Prescottella agglutinans]|nr:hypothetical protein [Prescottella agglutinans]